MKQFYEITYTNKFETNEKGELKQNVRNGFNADFKRNLSDFLNANGVSNVMIKEGLGIEVPNEIEGAITVVVSVTVKPLGFDLTVAKEEYETELAEKAEKELKAKAEKEKKIASKKVKATK